MSKKSGDIPSNQILDFIQHMSDYLEKDSITVEDVVQKIGTIKNDPGLPMPIALNSEINNIENIELARYPDSGLPYLLTFHLKENTHIRLIDLQSKFGDYQQIRSNFDRPKTFIFSPFSESHKWEVKIIAKAIIHQQKSDELIVKEIAIRRDSI